MSGLGRTSCELMAYLSLGSCSGGMVIQRLLQQIAYVAPGGGIVRPALHRLRGVRVGAGVWLGQQVYIDDVHPDAVTIGDD